MASKKKEDPTPAAAKGSPTVDGDDDESSSSSEDDDDDDLVLEGVLVRNPEVSDDSDDTSSEDDDDDDDDRKPPPSKKAKTANGNKKESPKQQPSQKQKKKSKQRPAGPDILQVDFIFCDMQETFFHGIKTLVTAATPLLAPYSSPLTDLLLENASIGTVVATEGDVDGNVFGFASVLNVTTHQDEPCIQALKQKCLDKCPSSNKKELEVVLSGKTTRPAGFYLHGRMVNMPLEIVLTMHEQLVIDMDWAVENAHGSAEMRKSLDFGAFCLLAPTYEAGGNAFYRNFDDEIFATHAEFTFEMELPKPYGSEDIPFCNVVVLTKTGHRAAMKALAEMVGSGGSTM